ncbi:hypothetical protein E2562_023570 [Oryza meyeriana var. granulata]|uniref:C2H2-type domain-containing protein n=1 Tax=Oryza meyeriana var. granulata TaxID=110450 RepID=A0A6G1E3A7_9ORYZ|nr:hypothetical protein E2562_023570 [Oryza meyeriana var. granulata]
MNSSRRQEGSPLDLNNLPDEFGKQPVESSTTTAASSAEASRITKKKSNGGKEEAGKVYECRFCSLKFCKSQALGGHMNRHRQERETETLNRARQLVFGNDSLAAVGAQLNFRDVNMGGPAAAPPPTLQMAGGGFRGGGGGIGDPCLPLRPVHPRLSPPQPPYHYLYTTSPSTLHPMSYPATYPAPPRQQPAVGDYVIGHAVSSGDALVPPPHRGSLSCFGAPLTAPANVQPADNGNCNCSFGCGHNRNVNAAS